MKKKTKNGVKKSKGINTDSGAKRDRKRTRVTRSSVKTVRMKGLLDFAATKTLVTANNHSGFSNELIVAICWKESSFDTTAQSNSSTARGLMSLTKPAVSDVNNNTPAGIHFEYSDMFDAGKNIRCGTWYLSILNGRYGDRVTALEHYGTGAGYADNLFTCESCLQSLVVVDPMACLRQIHP